MPNGPSKSSSAVRILLVEDNPLDAELLQAALTASLPCQIRVALTKASFEKELAADVPDIIVSDSNVLAFDGLTALRIAQNQYPDVPFIFCSGSLSELKRKEALAEGAVACVPKEDSFLQLVCVIKRLSGRHDSTS